MCHRIGVVASVVAAGGRSDGNGITPNAEQQDICWIEKGAVSTALVCLSERWGFGKTHFGHAEHPCAVYNFEPTLGQCVSNASLNRIC